VSNHADVVVVGAGLAGLRAADAAVAAGADVLVLEAAGRVGGRVWSHHFANGQWCERGAEFVDAHHHEVLGLVERFGLELLPATTGRDARHRRLDAGGRVTSFADQPSMLDDVRRWQSAKAELGSSIDLDDLTDDRAAALDRRTVADFVGGLGLSVYARVVIGRDLRTEFMVPPDELSLLHLAWVSALGILAGDGSEAYRIAGGNDQLAIRLAMDLGERIRLSTKVVDVDAATGRVRTAGGQSFRGGSVILAVPPAVLSRIEVDPALPAEIMAIGWGIGAKVSMQYARRMWRDIDADGSAVSDRAYGEVWETSIGQGGDAGILTALLSSNDGAMLASLPDVVQRVRGEIGRVFPGSALLAGESVVTNWTNNEHSLGCYAAFRPGQITTTLPLLGRRYGTVELAGEHTDVFAGFMEGALRSGVRAASSSLASGHG
jgi:monoamine oxidase